MAVCAIDRLALTSRQDCQHSSDMERRRTSQGTLPRIRPQLAPRKVHESHNPHRRVLRITLASSPLPRRPIQPSSPDHGRRRVLLDITISHRFGVGNQHRISEPTDDGRVDVVLEAAVEYYVFAVLEGGSDECAGWVYTWDWELEVGGREREDDEAFAGYSRERVGTSSAHICGNMCLYVITTIVQEDRSYHKTTG